MAAMLSAIGGGALEVAGFELVYVTAPGDGVRVGLADAWALRLESVPPVRRFASYRGQRHLSGLWWSATTGGHVGFESWLERDLLRTFSRRLMNTRVRSESKSLPPPQIVSTLTTPPQSPRPRRPRRLPGSRPFHVFDHIGSRIRPHRPSRCPG